MSDTLNGLGEYFRRSARNLSRMPGDLGDWMANGARAGIEDFDSAISGYNPDGSEVPQTMRGMTLLGNMMGGPVPKGAVASGIGRRSGLLFDYSNLDKVPNVPQRGLERYIPPKGVSERAQALDSPKLIRKVDKYVDRGLEMGGQEWYNAEPLRQAFIDELGDKAGPKAFEQYIDMVAATSPQSDVPTNIRNASYYYSLLKRGLPLPEHPPNPKPYGHKSQNLHIQNAQTVASPEGWDVIKNPKPVSFAENLKGNQRPVTVDTHNTRAWGRLSGNEEWVAPRSADNPDRRPRDMLASGTPHDDLRGADFVSQPRPNEYGFMEQLQQRLAKKKGISPAQYQSSLWVGAGDITGVGTPPEPFLRLFERRLALTAQKRGEDTTETLGKFIRGEAPLLSTGNPAAAAAGAAPEQPSEPDARRIIQRHLGLSVP